MKILFYDTKPYDREAFEKLAGKYSDIEIDYLKTDISYRTAPLSKGYDAVCLFVASDVGGRSTRISPSMKTAALPAPLSICSELTAGTAR